MRDDKSNSIKTGPILIGLSTVGILSPLVSGLLADTEGVLTRLFDLVANFQFIYIAVFLIGIVLSSFTSIRFILLIPIVLVPWFSASEMTSTSDTDKNSLNVATVNLNYQNNNLSAIKEWLANENADIVALIELSPDVEKELNHLKQYPYKSLYSDKSPFGIGVLSKLPLNSIELIRDNQNIPTLKTTFHWQGSDVNFIAFHPMPPITPLDHLTRNQKIKELMIKASQSELPTILAGDFNATPWSSAFEEISLTRASSLAPTWLSRYIGIPIDQILVSSHWRLSETKTTHVDMGSDHMPVSSVLVPTPEKQTRLSYR